MGQFAALLIATIAVVVAIVFWRRSNSPTSNLRRAQSRVAAVALILLAAWLTGAAILSVA